ELASASFSPFDSFHSSVAMKEEKCCCGLLKITTAVKIILWFTILFGFLHAVTPSILNVSATMAFVLKGIVIVAVLSAILALIGIRKDAPKLMKPAIIFNVIIQALLLMQVFYSIAAIFFPNIPLPVEVKDVMETLEIRFESVEDKVKNILQSIAAAILVINIVIYAISLRVLVLIVKCFFAIKSKRYQPVPVFRMPPRSLVVNSDQSADQIAMNSIPKPATSIEMVEAQP
ncbi:hypothetical protein PMAYCL1PPCAC_15305, partial [Pristionchus mayeri]